MSKKPLDKRISLPLFLAAVVLLTTGALTGVHLLTKDRIAANIEGKQYEGYKTILGITSFDSVKQLEVSETLTANGVTKKSEFIKSSNSLGVVYDATVKGWNEGLVFQVGFKDNIYAGFNVVSSTETSSIGGAYLKLVNDRISGKLVTDAILVDDSTYTGPTAPVTANAIRNVLQLCALDYTGEVVEEEDPEPTSLANLATALNTTEATSFTLLNVSKELKNGGILLKYDVRNEEASLGVVYEANVTGFHEGLHVLVGISEGKYTGFVALENNESDGYGFDYVYLLPGYITGKDVVVDILDDFNTVTGATITKNAMVKVFNAIATDYLGLGTPDYVPTTLANLNTVLASEGTGFNLLFVTKELKAGGIIVKYEVLSESGVLGYVYEADVTGFHDGLHVLVGVSEGKYTGFLALENNESDGYGFDYVYLIPAYITGKDVSVNILDDFNTVTGVTYTKNAIVKVFNAIANDYLEGSAA